MSPHQKLENLIVKLEQLQKQHQDTSIEIVRLREDVNALKRELGLSGEVPRTKELIDEIPRAKVKLEDGIPEVDIDFSKKPAASPPPLPRSKTKIAAASKPAAVKKAFDLEAFIGGNLINKVGILILIVGLGLFVKYAIDNGYFPPLIRLILSFLAGLTLVGFGYYLKPKYKTYSAVLFSGGMAVLYFSTYSGNAYYDPVLMPKTTAFILMAVFTVVTVIAAMIYNLEIIALLGLVGAYGVPFLLSDGSGDYKLLLSYIAIINAGVLAATIRKNWRITLYTGFVLTWIIFSFWVLVECDFGIETNTAWLFNVLFFLIFHAALITHNLIKDKRFTIDIVGFITLNAFVFYGLGMYILEETGGEKLQGIFTFVNGLVHLLVAFGVYRRLEDEKLFYALSGLFWVFLTIAIGVEFDAEIRPILWLGEALLLFTIGRRFEVQIYEGASFLVLFFGISFLLEVLGKGYYNSLVHHTLFLNKYFLVSLLSLGIIGAMLWVHHHWKKEWATTGVVNLVLPGLFIGLLYGTFFNEIYHQFEMAFNNSKIDDYGDYDILKFSTIWLMNYTFAFILGLYLFNRFYLKSKAFANFVAGLIFLVSVLFLSLGIMVLGELRTEYLNPDLNPQFSETGYWIWIRYISYLFLSVSLFVLYKLLDQLDAVKNIKIIFQLFVYLAILIVLSTELTTFMAVVVGVDTKSLTHKVGFSILWAMYSLVMIWVGFRQRSKLLRIAGMTLFGVTLLKVFLVDLIDISTESRILLFVAIGVLLLITSYFYQRFKNVLGVDEEGSSGVRSEE